MKIYQWCLRREQHERVRGVRGERSERVRGETVRGGSVTANDWNGLSKQFNHQTSDSYRIQQLILPNHYFQFKQFKVEQEKSSMKVCTDSCLFGAWIADKFERKCVDAKNILDIGSGTGLLSLIIAQKFAGTIDAIEINVSSYLQTKENFIKSPWNARLRVFHGDIKNLNSPVKYDFIISNPPFFENDLKSPDQNKNEAKHRGSLSLEALLQSIKNNLTVHGRFALLLPYHRIQYFKDLAREKDFYLSEELLVKQTPNHPYFRGILLFVTKPTFTISNELIIKDKRGNYTQSFQLLLRDYYLDLNP